MEVLPVVYIRAESHYDVGKAIGTTFKGFIDDYIKTSKNVELLQDFYTSRQGRSIFDEYLRNSEKHFPEIVSEIRGIADGSDQRFVDMFLLQLDSEILQSHQHEIPEIKVKPPKEDKGCTDILINTKDLRITAHNNDWSYEVSDRVYMGHVTIIKKDENEAFIKEQFLAYMYPGYLSGGCFAMNKDLVFSLNTVRPVTANRKGVPLAILLRKMLSCKSIEECAAIMENKPLGCAYGMNINIAHVNDQSMCSLEVYPEESNTRVSIMQVSNSHYCHTNHYKHLEKTKENSTEGSFRRLRLAEEMTSQPLTSVDDVKRILGDTRDELEPIYRIPTEKYLRPLSKTSATAIFDLKKQRLDVYRSNPKCSTPCFSAGFL